MQATSIVLMSAQQALQRSLDVIANNVANANTTGFKREAVDFNTVFESVGGRKQPLKLVIDHGTYRDTSTGELIKTGNQLDLAISGKGYFQIQKKDGSTAYTRDGSFQTDGEGRIVTHGGDIVLGDGGQAITLPETTSQINISSDGFITADTGTGKDLAQLGKIGIVNFDNEQLLQSAGENSYTTSQPSHPVNGNVDSDIVQGSIEQSNANPIEQMTSMIQILEDYQQLATIMNNEHDRKQNALDKLSKTTA